MRYKAIIFDLDGTLLNTIDDLADSVRYVQEKYGLEKDSTEVVRKHVGNGIRKLIERSIPDGEKNPIFEEAFEEFKRYYQIHCMDKTDLYPGIIELLKKLKKENIGIAIVSNKADAAVKKLYEIYFKEFTEVALGEMEDRGLKKKPAPDLVNLALEKLQVRREEALYVGDSEVDKKTADNSLMDCALCKWGFREEELLISLEPKYLIESPMELFEKIK